MKKRIFFIFISLGTIAACAYVYDTSVGKRLDGFVAYMMQTFHNTTLTAWVKKITRFNGLIETFMFVAGVTASFAIVRLYRVAAYYAFATVAAAISFGYIKHMLQRPRPPFALIDQAGFSFPSGHATMAAAMAFGLYYVVRAVRGRGVWSFLFWCFALVWAGIIGFTRLYLGVHWASDVLAGWALGFAWASAMSLVFFPRFNAR